MRKLLLSIFLLIFIVSPVYAQVRPSYHQGFARNASECDPQYAHLWKGKIGHWVPYLGVTGITTLRDVSGLGNHGTLNGSMTIDDWVIGREGYALSFDGGDDYVGIDISNNLDLISTTPPSFSISAWFFPRDPITDLSGIGMVDGGANSARLFFRTTNRFGFQLKSGSTFNFPADTFSNEWVHVVGVYNSVSTELKLYLNGILKDTDTAADTDLSGLAPMNLRIGDSGNEFNGLFDDVRLYDRVLTANEIWKLFNDPLCDLRLRTTRVYKAPVASAVLRQTDTDSVVLGAGSASQTDTLNVELLDTGKAFMVFGVKGDDASPEFGCIRGQITNTTTLTFTRKTAAASPAITIRWYVAEFTSGVSVQRGTEAMSDPSMPHDITISSVDTSKAFPIISYERNGSTYAEDDYTKAKITSSTNLQLNAQDTYTSDVDWQVVEFTSGADVQTGDITFTTSETSDTGTLSPAIVTANSFLVYSYDTSAGLIDDRAIRGQITDTTTVTFDRVGQASTMNLTWYLIELTGGGSVQHGSEDFITTDVQEDVTITAVTIAESIAFDGALATCQGGKTAYDGDDNPYVVQATQELTSTTNLQITRGAHGSTNADIGWQVISFGEGAPPAASRIILIK